MPYTLYITNYTYSSWSLRGWLLFKSFHIPFKPVFALMRTEAFPQLLAQTEPARLVPSMRVHQGDHSYMVWDSLAMMETLAEQVPESGLLPQAAEQRAVTRALCAEMHSGFQAMRREMPMNLQRRYVGYGRTKAVQKELDRFEYLLAWAKETYPGTDPWIIDGKFSAADVFYIPLASRLHSYGISVQPLTQTYIDAVLNHPDFILWTKMAMEESMINPNGEMRKPDETQTIPKMAAPYQGDKPQAINFACPHSGKPIQEDSLAILNDKNIIGFCNAECRDDFINPPQSCEAILRSLPFYP